MTPNTTVTLYATPFDISNKYVIAADSPGEALAIVSSYPSKVYTDCYWQRDNDFVFRANGNINEVEQYNYCVYLNNGRYNFTFITQCDYVNDAMTLVHLALDPWLNFAGQYVFHDSPMVRCHPSNDNSPEGFYTSEPIECRQRPQINQEGGGHWSENELSLYIMTSIKATDLPLDNAVDDYWNGMLQLAQQSGVSDLIAWTRRMKPHYSNVGNVLQPNTSVVDTTVGQSIIASFIQNGMSSAIIGGYHVPTTLTGGGRTGIDVDEIPPITFDFDVPTTLLTTGHKWRKLLVSPQFRRLILNAAGNTREIPFEYLAAKATTETPITIKVDVNPSYNGFFAMKVSGLGDVMDNYICQSPSWDRVPLMAFGVDNTVFKQAIMNTVTNVAATGFDTIGELTNKVNWLKHGIAGTLASAGREVFEGVAAEYQNSLNTQRAVNSGNIVIGGAAGSMVAYNQTAPLFMAGVYGPSASDCVRIAKMFGTYGYMMEGEIVPITFKNLPHWTYYQTVEASLEGRKVPQRYLTQIIQRFNAGIFVFNSVADYKDFSNALDNHY